MTTPDGTTGTLVKGWVSDFLDVPENHQFHTFITQLISNAITVGIGGGLYGVDQPTLRQQMAALVLKARHGLCYVPPPCTGQFDDVPCPSTFAAWIEAFADEGITGGCGGNNFCPAESRPQRPDGRLPPEGGARSRLRSARLRRPLLGCAVSLVLRQLDRAARDGSRSPGGCGGGHYCPTSSITRGQMAVFLVKTFKLP